MSRSGTYDPKYGFLPDDDCPEPQKPLTNADRIRTMSDEELAQALPFPSCPPHEGKCTFSSMIASSCDDCWLQWLREEVKDGDSG